MSIDETKEELNKFVISHGNHLHAKVVSLLRKEHWHVLVSPYYRDIGTDKAREADIIAEKDFPVVGPFGSQYLGCVRFRLIIECKYIKDNTVCWFDAKDTEHCKEMIMRDTPLKSEEINSNITKHHWYTKSDVAKLFASSNKNNSVKEVENEVLFSAFDKVLNSLIYYRDVNFNSPNTVIPANARRQQLLFPKTITYPVVITDNFAKMYQTSITAPDKVEKLVSQFTAEVTYAHLRYVAAGRFNLSEYFLVDVVPLSEISDFLSLIEKDFKAMEPMLVK